VLLFFGVDEARISHSISASNTAEAFGGGGMLVYLFGTLLVTHCTILDNQVKEERFIPWHDEAYHVVRNVRTDCSIKQLNFSRLGLWFMILSCDPWPPSDLCWLCREWA